MELTKEEQAVISKLKFPFTVDGEMDKPSPVNNVLDGNNLIVLKDLYLPLANIITKALNAYYAPPETTSENVPNWYAAHEIEHYLLCRNYSMEIAKELSKVWADGLQSAFAKGVHTNTGNLYEKLFKLVQNMRIQGDFVPASAQIKYMRTIECGQEILDDIKHLANIPISKSDNGWIDAKANPPEDEEDFIVYVPPVWNLEELEMSKIYYQPKMIAAFVRGVWYKDGNAIEGVAYYRPLPNDPPIINQ